VYSVSYPGPQGTDGFAFFGYFNVFGDFCSSNAINKARLTDSFSMVYFPDGYDLGFLDIEFCA
jgi:hypothetical protein